MKDQIQWVAPSPLWASAAGAEDASVRGAVRQPAVLRFATDTFMEDFLKVLEADPSALTNYLAEPETWRGPSPAPPPVESAPRFLQKFSRLRLAANRALDNTSDLSRQRSLVARAAAGSAADGPPLKLYQPAHLRYYLVTACLVCRVPGLPDHLPNRGREETISFVVRRLYQKEGSNLTEEYAFVTTPRGTGWQRVTGAASTLAEGEERLPLFQSTFEELDGRRRRLYAGMVPVGRREAYMGAGEVAPNGNGSANGATKKTARKIHFRTQIAEPWKSLLERADAVNRLQSDSKEAPPAADLVTARKESREQIQTMSWYILLDLSKYLSQYLPQVWAAILDETKDEDEDVLKDNPNEAKLYKALRDAAATDDLKNALKNAAYTKEDVAGTMVVALRKLATEGWGEKLESVSESYDRDAPNELYPDFLFPLADPEKGPPLPPETVTPEPTPADESGEAVPLDQSVTPPDVRARQQRVDNLVALVVRALPADDGERAPAPPLASQPVLDTREGNFVIRCVYERPLCGPLDPPVLSGPTASFQMAGFFDPDAPARPIRIALPIDTTPAGLRKFDKNTVFMISDALCGQITRMRGITFGDLVLSVLPWPFHKNLSSKVGKVGPCQSKGVELGMMCTLSIPIITICALILLMVIVLLFDFIFKWIPLFIMCFPLPKFKSKR
jgi:hypothetical protein